ncbi:MAG: hypothetical protein NW224_25970 [Leptolyngbyaceae cyanobacterium bins.302]|nr:hypothetical protein [Leptolyngbyaceae cyanobacterium bins.302]
MPEVLCATSDEEEMMPEEQPPIPESSDSDQSDSDQSDSKQPDLTAADSLDQSSFEPESSKDSEQPDLIAEGFLDQSSLELKTAVELQPRSTPEPAPVTPASTAQSQTLQTLQAFWRDTQPKLKAGTIKVLKTTIQLLEGAVARLEADPNSAAATPASSAPPGSLPSRMNDFGITLQQGWQRFWNWWNGVLPKIRGVLPASINETLPDRALTGAIAGVLVLVLWLGSSIFSSQPPPPVAVVPPSKTAPAKPIPAQEKQEPKPKNLPEVKVVPPPKPTPKATETPKPIAETPKPAPSTTPTPAPSPSPTPSPAPSPTPTLKLTPEQTLIARIQDQVATVSDQYVTGLIQSVQANFRSSRLTVKVGNGWYSLSAPQQDNLANDVLKRTQQLNFIKLEMTDANGVLLARSPVVGSEMVVLKRSI